MCPGPITNVIYWTRQHNRRMHGPQSLQCHRKSTHNQWSGNASSRKDLFYDSVVDVWFGQWRRLILDPRKTCGQVNPTLPVLRLFCACCLFWFVEPLFSLKQRNHWKPTHEKALIRPGWKRWPKALFGGILLVLKDHSSCPLELTRNHHDCYLTETGDGEILMLFAFHYNRCIYWWIIVWLVTHSLLEVWMNCFSDILTFQLCGIWFPASWVLLPTTPPFGKDPT